MKRFAYCLFAVFLLLLSALPVEARRKRKSPSAPVRTQLPAPVARRLSYYYQEGIKQKLANNLSEAYDLFCHCLAIDPENPDAIYELGYLQFYLEQDSLGTAMLRRAAELDDRNPRYLQSLAAAYLAQNKYEQAIPVVERLSQLQTRRSDVLYQLVELYKSSGNTDEAIRVLDRIELLEGRSLQTSLQKYAFYIDKGKKQEAFRVLETLERESPYDLRIPIIRGRQYLEQEEPERALECFETVRRTDPQNVDLRMAMMDYYAQTGQQERRTALRDSILFGPDTSDELRAKMTALLVEDLKGQPDQQERVLSTLDTLIRRSPGSALMRSLKVSYLMSINASEDTIAVALRDLLTVAPDNENALTRLLVYYLRNEDIDNVAEICRMGINAYPDGLTYYFYLGIALSQQKQNEAAIETLQAGLRQTDGRSNPDYVADIYSILGDLYHEEGRVEDSFMAYDSCLVYKDDHASCLNNYAYYLSLRNERLADAERMAYRAIKTEPLNKTYLDTYAWVLFMQENYTMAKFYIDRVISPSQSDSVLLADETVHTDVLEHAGDIYAQTGHEEEALRYWSLAQQKGGGSALLEKKLKLKKYVNQDTK